ncbi:MAG: hypothetical protein P1P79_07525, partial [Lutibacter sp.]|nr:hypothetical protein [Lutibacter sp.]
KYLELEREKNKRRLLKDKYDLTLSRWKYYTFWFVFIFGLFGGVYSLYDFITGISNNNHNKYQEFNHHELKAKQKIEPSTVKVNNDSLFLKVSKN